MEKQVTEFQDGILPWSYQNPIALVFDEYDAGRPDVMFVIQRILEAEGRLTLLDQSRIIKPHPFFQNFCYYKHNRLGRYYRIISWHTTDQSRTNG